MLWRVSVRIMDESEMKNARDVEFYDVDPMVHGARFPHPAPVTKTFSYPSKYSKLNLAEGTLVFVHFIKKVHETMVVFRLQGPCKYSFDFFANFP